MNRGIAARQAAARARLYASDAQVSYLRKLLNEAFARGYDHGFNIDTHHMERVERSYASRAIDALKSAKAAGWSRGTAPICDSCGTAAELQSNGQYGHACPSEVAS